MRISFPWLALGLGLLVSAVLVFGGAIGPESERRLPLLTLLIVAEFGFFVNAIGAGLALRQLSQQGLVPGAALSAGGCAVLAGGFLWAGLRLWPGGFPTVG